MLEVLKVIILGIVQGITEWLPISSTGHLILVEQLIQLKQSEAFTNMFNVVIQFGSILTDEDGKAEEDDNSVMD